MGTSESDGVLVVNTDPRSGLKTGSQEASPDPQVKAAPAVRLCTWDHGLLHGHHVGWAPAGLHSSCRERHMRVWIRGLDAPST